MRHSKSQRQLARVIMVCVLSFWLSAQLAAVATGQTGAPPSSPPPAPDCKQAKWGERCTIRIDRAAATLVAPGTFQVASGTQVGILIYNKSPFETAKFEATRTEVAPPPDAAAGLLTIVGSATKAITLASVAIGALRTSRQEANDAASPRGIELARIESAARSSKESLIVKLLREIIQDRNGNQEEIQGNFDIYKQLDERLGAFFNRRDYCTEGIGQVDPVPSFDQLRLGLIASINGLGSEPPISVEGEEANLKTAKKLLQELIESGSPTPDFPRQAAALVNQASGRIQLFKEGIANLNEARQEFAKTRDTLEGLQTAKCRQVIGVVADRQANIAGNIVITNLITGKPLPQQLYTKIGFRDLPRASLSAGILISPLEKRSFNTAQVFDGLGATPTDPVGRHAEIRGEASRPQVVPFSFVNVRLMHWRVGDRLYSFNLAPGVGVNPNGGTNEVEFAFGASFGVNNFYFFGGAHFGREANLVNGFSIGDRVPDIFVPPVSRQWKTNFGFGVSYRLPLP